MKPIKVYEEELSLLEQEHVRVQFLAIPHFLVHWKMFVLAFQFRVWPEFFGQVPRMILAIPGSLTGKAPRGNLGSTKMGIFEVRKD